MVAIRPDAQNPQAARSGPQAAPQPASPVANPAQPPATSPVPNPTLNIVDVRKLTRLDFNDCVEFALPASQPGQAAETPPAKQYTAAERTPPHGKTLPTDLRKIDEKKLLDETGGQGALWAVGDWKPGARPLILVHGIGSDFADLQPIIDKFKDAKPPRQILVYAYSDLGEFTEENGVQLAYQMTALKRDYPWSDSLDIVAHSMGGIVGRRALNELAAGQLGGIEKFKDISFTAVDTPWHGFPGPGIRLNVVQGGMDMQASSELFTGTDEMPDEASRKGLTGVTLPPQVKVNLLFADNEAAGLKRDGIKDYTDFIKDLKPAKLEKFVHAMTRGNREQMLKLMPLQAFNLFSALQADSQWPQLRQEMMDLEDSRQLSNESLSKLLQRYLPRFAGEHSGVLANPALLTAVAGRLGQAQ
ncbi:MAG: esterase/lipase family protein [Candidatus Sericytochromatia bacterium]